MKVYSVDVLREQGLDPVRIDQDFTLVQIISSVSGEYIDFTEDLYKKGFPFVEKYLIRAIDQDNDFNIHDLSHVILDGQMTVMDFIHGVYLECKANIWFFLKNFCYVQNSEGKPTKFKMTLASQFQIEMFQSTISNVMYNVRQTGSTITMAAMIAWMMAFRPKNNFKVISKDVRANQLLGDIVKSILNAIPKTIRLFLPHVSWDLNMFKRRTPLLENEDAPVFIFIDDMEFFEVGNEIEREILQCIVRPESFTLVAASKINKSFEKNPIYMQLMANSFINYDYSCISAVSKFRKTAPNTASIMLTALDEKLIVDEDDLTINRQRVCDNEVFSREFCPQCCLLDRVKRYADLQAYSTADVIPRVAAIACVDKSLGLGLNGKLHYHLKDDMNLFRCITSDNMVVMGRKTMESLPDKKPLKDRRSLVITHCPDEDIPDGFESCTMEDAIKIIKKHIESHPLKYVFIIGGAEIYNQMLKYCSEVYLTEVANTRPASDVFFPEEIKDIEKWSYTNVIPTPIMDHSTGYSFMVKRYIRVHHNGSHE